MKIKIKQNKYLLFIYRNGEKYSLTVPNGKEYKADLIKFEYDKKISKQALYLFNNNVNNAIIYPHKYDIITAIDIELLTKQDCMFTRDLEMLLSNYDNIVTK